MHRRYVVRPLFAIMAMIIRGALFFGLAMSVILSPAGASTPSWTPTNANALVSIDDDIARNMVVYEYFSGLEVSEARFFENGFAWHIVRFKNTARPDGPVWVVPHDDENAAFDGMIAAVRQYGGVGLAVNSGTGSARRQTGTGQCGVRNARVNMCDPNRNFANRTPVFTGAFVDQFSSNQPVIALHTNSPGFNGDGEGGRGDITILDRNAYLMGKIAARKNGHLAVNPQTIMANTDTLALSAFLEMQGVPSNDAQTSAKCMADAGIHFWHEEVGESDGSLSNYLAIHRPDIAYINVESRAEDDLALAAQRHGVMIAAYLGNCARSGNEPGALP